MVLNYENIEDIIIKRLEVAHNSQIARIRNYFFEKENEFFKKHIKNQRVLVAGSGLGHDSFELAHYNSYVIGVDILSKVIEIAEENCQKEKIKNIEFRLMDFTKLDYADKYFDCAVLNMGTISNFEDKAGVIKELLRVSNMVYLDFYHPILQGLEIRKKMYEEEKWINVRIEGFNIVSDDGLDSKSISKEEMTKIVNSIGAKVKYYSLCKFAIIAEITR